jgi:hypothetical protein
MGSMKDALTKAGFRSEKMENHREKNKGKTKAKESVQHQKTRHFCEECKLTQPDVELYKHRMPTTEAEWICLSCVDRLMIEDRFRKTEQSDVSKKGMFRRFYGATKDFSKEEPQRDNRRGGRPDGNKRPDGNRAPHKKKTRY